MQHSTSLHLAKQNFKFSSAHFLIFDSKNAEMLHGHNYQVKVDLFFLQNKKADELGYHIDFGSLKKIIKEMCDVWDEHVLLPENHPDMKYKVSSDKKNYEIKFRDRFYSLPVIETIWLPITNTSVENLSLLFARQLYNKLKKSSVNKVRVSIEETRGQIACSSVGE